jgi:hypothetical protein
MKAKSKKPTGKKPGAQPKNKNALKHGYYAEQFNADEKKRLDSSDNLDVLAEINLIRVQIDRLTEQISFKEITRKDNNGEDFRDSHYLSQLNTLSAMTGSMATLVRTHYLTHGKSGDVQSAILAALEELRLEMGL